jgi:hypothetical protein
MLAILGTFPQHKGVASKALVIMLGKISTRWKQIAAFYYTGDSTNGMILGDILLEHFQSLLQHKKSLHLN